MNSKTLLAALPLALLTGALASAIIFFPDSKDIRPRASDPATFNPSPTLTPTTTPDLPTAQPEIVCSDLYSPVCGSDNLTYDSACEAQLAGVQIISNSPCPQTN